MERDYAGETRVAHEYVAKLKREEWYSNPLRELEYNEELREFEAEVLLNEGFWMTKQFGYTIEFATSKRFFEEKCQILERSSQRLKAARWRTMRCSTCKGYNEDTPIHVDIEHAMDWEEQQEASNIHYETMRLLRKRFPKGTGHFNIELLEDLLETMDPKSDLGLELSLAIDEAKEALSLIPNYY